MYCPFGTIAVEYSSTFRKMLLSMFHIYIYKSNNRRHIRHIYMIYITLYNMRPVCA
jgi:hypothetical protein